MDYRMISTGLAIGLLLISPTHAQLATERVLKGQMFSVESGDFSPIPLPGVTITVRETGNSALTNQQGLFRISLGTELHAGHEVTLIHDRVNFAILSPYLGKQQIPDDLEKVVEVRMLPKGSKLYWDEQGIHFEEFITRTANESAKQLGSQTSGDAELSASINELGRYYGFTPAEVRREISKWIKAARKDPNDFRKQGMADFAEKRFLRAAENFDHYAEAQEKQAAEALRGRRSRPLKRCGRRRRGGSWLATRSTSIGTSDRHSSGTRMPSRT